MVAVISLLFVGLLTVLLSIIDGFLCFAPLRVRIHFDIQVNKKNEPPQG